MTACFVFLASAGFGCADVPELSVPRVKTPPLVDGYLNDECWQTPPSITDFRLIDKGRPVPTQATKAWVAWDDSAFYVAVYCHEEHLEMVQSYPTGIDGNMWKGSPQDCMEIFLMPGSPYYYHFAANLVGSRYDARTDTLTGKKDAHWRADWQVAAQRQKDTWTMEIAIPFACMELGAQRLADGFRFNIGREERRLTEFACWPASGFHEYREFAILKDVAPDPKRYGIILQGVSIGQRRVGENTFSAMVAEEAVPGCPMTLHISVRPLSGKEGTDVSSRVVSTVGAKIEQAYVIPPVEGNVAIRVDCIDASGRIRASFYNLFNLPPLLDAELDLPLLYKSERYASLTGRINLAENKMKGASLTATLMVLGKGIMSQKVEIQPDGRFESRLPIRNMPVGSHAVDIRLMVPEVQSQPLVKSLPLRVIRGPL